MRTIAKSRHANTNRVLVDQIQAGIEPKEAEKQKFFDLADRLTATSDPAERKRINENLARLTFGKK